MSIPQSSNVGSWIGTTVKPNAPSPVPWPTVVSTVSAQVIGASNPSRNSLYFINASATNTVWICPALTATGSALTAVANGAGSCPIPALTGLPISGSALQGWNAVTAVGTANFTVWEFSAE